MIKKNKGKIAGLPYDDWLEDKLKVPTKAAPTKRYYNKTIAFLDVLGIKDLIDKNRNGNEYIAIDKIEEIRKIVRSSVSTGKNIDYLHLSDSIVFASETSGIINLITLLATIQMRVLKECQLLLRGAIAIGDAIVQEDGKFIIGPAYIQAFQLQEHDAIYPRIIVDKNVIDQIIKNKIQLNELLRYDFDKEYFIDYIKVFMKNESIKKQDIKISFRREDIFNYLKLNCNKYFKEEKHNIYQKYGWTIQYYSLSGVWEDD